MALGTAWGMTLARPTSGNRAHPPNFSENGPSSPHTPLPFLDGAEGSHLEFRADLIAISLTLVLSVIHAQELSLGRSLWGTVSREPLNYLFSKLSASPVHLQVSTTGLHDVHKDC